MAQTTCQKCGYPYATSRQCPNCGKYPKNVSLTPSQQKAGCNVIAIVVIGIVLISILKALNIDTDDYSLYFIIGFIVLLFYFVNSGKKKG